MTTRIPLHVFQTHMLPSTAGRMRAALIGGALLLAALGFVLPLLLGAENMLLTAVFLGVAVVDLVLSAVLPALLSRQPGPLRYELYRDGLRVVSTSKATPVDADVPYTDITAVEELTLADKDQAAGWAGLRLVLAAPRPEFAALPNYGTSPPALSLRGLRGEDNALARFRERLGARSGRAA